MGIANKVTIAFISHYFWIILLLFFYYLNILFVIEKYLNFSVIAY